MPPARAGTAAAVLVGAVEASAPVTSPVRPTYSADGEIHGLPCGLVGLGCAGCVFPHLQCYRAPQSPHLGADLVHHSGPVAGGDDAHTPQTEASSGGSDLSNPSLPGGSPAQQPDEG
jgi:hypothetical protein